jgi:hypothetical protein
MHQQAVNQTCKNTSMNVALAALGTSIARWTDKEGLLAPVLT